MFVEPRRTNHGEWGGVCRDDVGYIGFDLEQFARAPRLKPSAADLDLGRRLVELLRTCPESMTSTKILPSLRILPGNKAERSVLLDIFGVCGILQTPHNRGYATPS